MKLDTWLKSVSAARGVSQRSLLVEIAGKSSIKAHTAWLIAHGKNCSRELAANISAATSGEVSIEELLYPDGLPPGARMCPVAVDSPGNTDCDPQPATAA